MAEDPDYYCDKQKTRGKYAGLFCGRNLNHRGDCEWFKDEDREVSFLADADEKNDAGETVAEISNVIPFHQPTEVPTVEEPVATVNEPAPTVEEPTATVEEPAPTEGIQFRKPVGPPVFEDPDLRSSGSYQHPVSGEKVPGVTTISGLFDKSSFLVPWSAKLAAEWAAANADLLASIPDEATRAAAIKTHAEAARSEGRDEGSLAHNTIEAIIRGEPVTVHPSIQTRVDGFMEWAKEYVAQIVLLEATVWSNYFNYAGTLDLGVTLKTGELCLVDIKTGKDVHNDAVLQINALARAELIVDTAGERPNLQWARAGVLHLPPPILTATGRPSQRGKWSFRPVRLSETDFDCFIALRRAWDWEHKLSDGALGGKQTKLPGVTAS